jgi:hypothetical protein
MILTKEKTTILNQWLGKHTTAALIRLAKTEPQIAEALNDFDGSYDLMRKFAFLVVVITQMRDLIIEKVESIGGAA